MSSRSAVSLAAIVLVASSLSAKHAETPLSPGAVLLLAGKDDTASLSALKTALLSSEPSIRATAARVIGTGAYPTLAADVTAALARERDPDAGTEMLRDVLWLGGDSALSTADEQAHRLGPAAAFVVAGWLARMSPQRLLERIPALAATPDSRPRLIRILEMGAAQHPEMADALQHAWQGLPAEDADAASASDRAKPSLRWLSAAPITAALVTPLDPSLMSTLLDASSCKPTADRAGLAGIVFRPDGRPAHVELGAERLPAGCVAALAALARTTVAGESEPVVAGQLKYIVVPFTKAFEACTAAVEKHPANLAVEPGAAAAKITPPHKTRDVRPVYPPAAQNARIQGTVTIEADVALPGCIAAAHVVKSIRGLDVAAPWAVSQWEYSRALLNGKPVPVVMTVTVDFRL